MSRSVSAQTADTPSGHQVVGSSNDLAKSGLSQFPSFSRLSRHIDFRDVARGHDEQVGKLYVVTAEQVGCNLPGPGRARTTCDRRIESRTPGVDIDGISQSI